VSAGLGRASKSQGPNPSNTLSDRNPEAITTLSPTAADRRDRPRFRFLARARKRITESPRRIVFLGGRHTSRLLFLGARARGKPRIADVPEGLAPITLRCVGAQVL
jgi:hypothetical protein